VGNMLSHLTVIVTMLSLIGLSAVSSETGTEPSEKSGSSTKSEPSSKSDSSTKEEGSTDDPLVKSKKTGNLDETLKEIGTYRTEQFINLTLGIEQDITLPPLPSGFEVKSETLKGDFRKIVGVSVNKELGVLRFSPKREGFASLTVHDKKNGRILVEYRIDVRKNRLEKVVREVRSLLGDVEGIVIRIVNNRVTIDGQILLPADMSRIYNVQRQFGDQVSVMATMSPLAIKMISSYLAREINNPEIEVRTINDKILISGFVNNEKEAERIKELCELYLPDLVLDPVRAEGVYIKTKRNALSCNYQLTAKEQPTPAPPKMIQLVVHYVELAKAYSKSFKFQWTPQISDNTGLEFKTGGSGGNIITSLTGIVSNLLPKLNWAKQHNHARILKSTSLIVQEGKKGEIAQTIDVPYVTLGPNNTQGTAFVKTGLQSGITAMIQDGKSGSVGLDMQFSISTLLSGDSGGTPQIAENKINTMVTVRDRQSAAVGGLIGNGSSTGYNRTPSGVKDPLISLLASKNFQRDQSQFVVFVTPVIKTSASAGSEQIKKKFRLRE
jgi:pilus assembly protein CpaC